jgi:hypothetical protein
MSHHPFFSSAEHPGSRDLVPGRAKNMPIPVNPVCPVQHFVIPLENSFQWQAW